MTAQIDGNVTFATPASEVFRNSSLGSSAPPEPGRPDPDGHLTEQSYFQLVIVNIVLGLWLIYALYFNSRVFGFIISAIISRTTKMDFDLGSFSLSVLSGKIMFRYV